jgi:protein SCO1/2
MRRTACGQRWRLAATMVAIASLLTACNLPFTEEEYTYFGGTFDPPNPAPAIDMTDQHGNPFSLDTFKGEVVLVYFGYTFCPDFCPTTLAEVQRVEQSLGDDAGRVEVVFVTVDPERDSQARLKEYMDFFNPDYFAVRGTEDATLDIARSWGVTYAKEEPQGDNGYYLVSHSTSLFAVDPEGNLALVWAYGTESDKIVSDIQHLLDS